MGRFVHRRAGEEPVPPPADFGALVTTTARGIGEYISFDGEEYDLTDWFTPESTDITVIEDVSLVRVGLLLSSAAAEIVGSIDKDLVTVAGLPVAGTKVATGSIYGVHSAPIAVSAGQVFNYGETVGQSDDTGLTAAYIEILDPDTEYALVTKAAGESPLALSQTFATVNVDTSGFTNPATPKRLTVTEDGQCVQLRCNLAPTTANITNLRRLSISKNLEDNLSFFTGSPYAGQITNAGMNVVSAPHVASAGDYFHARFDGGGGTIGTGAFNWMSIEVIPPEWDRVLLTRNVNQDVVADTPATIIFNTAAEDTPSAWDGSTKVIVPAGRTRARCAFNHVGSAGGVARLFYVTVNGEYVPGMPRVNTNSNGIAAFFINGGGAWVDVVEGDEIELVCVASASVTFASPDPTVNWLSVMFQ